MDKERRMVEHECRVEERAGGGHKITGYAAVYGSRTDLGSFTEEVEAGAFADALETSDVRGLFNHDPNHVLGRSTSGTLRLSEDDHGLKYDLDVPNTRTGTELVELIKRGDISGNSFSFTVKEDAWSPADASEEKSEGAPKMHRRIVKVDRLFDVGPVTYPAYEATTVSARSREAAETEWRKISERSTEAAEHIKRIHECRRKRLALMERS